MSTGEEFFNTENAYVHVGGYEGNNRKNLRTISGPIRVGAFKATKMGSRKGKMTATEKRYLKGEVGHPVLAKRSEEWRFRSL